MFRRSKKYREITPHSPDPPHTPNPLDIVEEQQRNDVINTAYYRSAPVPVHVRVAKQSTIKGTMPNLKKLFTTGLFARKRNQIAPEEQPCYTPHYITSSTYKNRLREFIYSGKNSPGEINSAKAMEYYSKLFAELKSSVTLYYIDLNIIFLLIKDAKPALLTGISEVEIMDFINRNEQSKQTYYIDSSRHHDKITGDIDNFIKLFLNIFNCDPIKRIELDSLERVFFKKFKYEYELFKAAVCKNGPHNDQEVKFVASLLLRNKIYIPNVNLHSHAEPYYYTVLKIFNLSEDNNIITFRDINFMIRGIGRFPTDEVTVVKQHIGGKIKKPLYKLSNRKVNLSYKNKKIVRNIYLKIKNNKEYCKINKKYILLSKLVRI